MNLDERTALLGRPTEGPLPAVLPAVARLKNATNVSPEPDTSMDEQQQTAFRIIVYLHLYQSLFTSVPVQDIRTVWTSAKALSNNANETEARLLDRWSTYLDTHPSLSDVQSLLWSEFPLEHDSTRCTKVVDCLYSEHVPPAFLVHPVIQAAMMATWKVGLRHRDDDRGCRIWRRFDALISPRAMHFLHLLGHLLFVGTLAYYLLYPPPFISDYTGYAFPEVFLVLMAVSSLFVPWTLHCLSHLLVLLAFVFTLPPEPLPGSLAFVFLHLALIVHVVSLHLPYPPSIVYILYPSISVPLSSLLVQSTIRLLLPLMLFFLPALLFATCLVSASLAYSPPFFVNEVPMDTRASFFLLFVLVVSASLFSFAVSLSATDMSLTTSAEPWDRYTPVVGRSARKMFYRAVARYTGHTFFPPFNVLLLITVIPAFFRRLLGYPRLHVLKEMQIFLWRISVGILAVVVGCIWLWGSL